MDKMLAGEVPLSDDEYRAVVLAALRDLRSKYTAINTHLKGNGEIGLYDRVTLIEAKIPPDLHEIVDEWKKIGKQLDRLWTPIVVAVILAALAFLWSLLTHQVSIGPFHVAVPSFVWSRLAHQVAIGRFHV